MEKNHDQKIQDYGKQSPTPKQIMPRGQEDERNCGFWNQEEQLHYVIFIDFFKEDLQSKQKRKFNKIFKAMSQFLKTRDAIQCRSHHMKQLRTLRKIRNIIRETKRKVGEDHYKQIYDKITSDKEIFKSKVGHSTRNKTPKKIFSKTKEIGIQAMNDTGQKVQAEIPQEISNSSLVPIPQSNFAVYPFWNMTQIPILFNFKC